MFRYYSIKSYKLIRRQFLTQGEPILRWLGDAVLGKHLHRSEIPWQGQGQEKPLGLTSFSRSTASVLCWPTTSGLGSGKACSQSRMIWFSLPEEVGSRSSRPVRLGIHYLVPPSRPRTGMKNKNIQDWIEETFLDMARTGYVDCYPHILYYSLTWFLFSRLPWEFSPVGLNSNNLPFFVEMILSFQLIYD